MFQLESLEDGLYLFALRLFQAAGYTNASDVMFCNHTPDQVIYFDTEVYISLSNNQRNLLKDIDCISHLFDIKADYFEKTANGPVSFYSIEILSSKETRSQTAYDTHSIFIPVLSGKTNVILFRHDNKVMLSVQGFDSDVYLSDWFDCEDDFEELTERIHIANISMKSIREFTIDFLYSCTRWYYTHANPEDEEAYGRTPASRLGEFEDEEILFCYKEHEERIKELLKTAEYEYGNDYVEQGNIQSIAADIGAELDLLELELDIDGVDTDLFGEDCEKDDDFFDEDEVEKDKYEFDDLDEEIFNDPILMVKHFEKYKKKTEELSKSESEQKQGKDKSVLGKSLIDFFTSFDLEVIDKRSSGGCLWVVGDKDELSKYLELVETEYGVKGSFGLGRATHGRIGWYTKSEK